jgi:hypothetical protein
MYWDTRGVYKVLVRKPQDRNNLEDLDAYWRIILKRLFKRWDVEA